MKKNHLYGLISAAVLMASASGCSDDFFNQSGDGSGKIKPLIGLDTEAITSRSANASRAGGDVTVNDLKLRLTGPDGNVRTWNSPSEFPTNEEFKTGAYTLEACYGDVEDEGFEKPAYFGSTDFVVEYNETTSVAITAGLANSMVTVKTTEAFQNYFTDWAFQLHADGGDYIDYAKDETRAAYLRPGKVTIYADVTKPNGVSGLVEAATFTAEPRHHYTVTITANGGNVGDAQMVVSFDDTLDREDVIIDLSDEILTEAPPVVNVEGFDPAEIYTLIDGGTLDITPSLFINARGGLSAVTMTTQSKTLEEQGWPTEINLLAATSAQQQTLASLGLTARGLYKNPDKIATIDLSGVISNLRYRPVGSNSTVVTFVVKDKNNKVSDPISLTINVEQARLELHSGAIIHFGYTECDVELEYNGANPTGAVTIQYRNDRNTWSTTSATFTKIGNNLYSAHVTGLPSTGDVELRAVSGEMTSTATVTRGTDYVMFNAASINMYSDRGTIDLDSTFPLSEVSIDLSSDNGATWAPATYVESRSVSSLRLTGLTPGTHYMLRVTCGIFSDIVEFDTEAQQQLPNANMESWSSSGSGKTAVYTCTGWGTANPMTTSQGADLGYCRTSGTLSTDGRNGGNAALIRTVGWGSGNTNAGGLSIIKYVDAGLLHLGDNRNSRNGDDLLSTADLNCGIDFASRPASMSFWYKYSPKNGDDKGYAEIRIIAANGTVIASNNIALGSASDWTQATVALTYPENAPKAAKVYVKFLSSNNSSYLSKSNLNYGNPHLGSQLTVDDITLNY